ncbi:MAG TPA: hypothetical protein GXX24_10550 [Paracoccus solventivorans]|uniref:Uncharacterized protein n=1 Tax=Paracoccus solventivorans TaxID=53463 RepID=A0A832QX42_9RHOB|nr:hypothetical protein [Paracoccus solventivorans]HHW34561.1 hypothetical protein [Paracoccus solventivorans]
MQMKRQLLAGASVLALAMTAGGGIALADIEQTVTNSDTVTTSGGEVSTGAIDGTATAGQARVGATGALAGVSATVIESGYQGAPLGTVEQAATNTGAISTSDGSATVNGNLAAAGSSASVGATGAAASMSETIIGATDANEFQDQTTATSVDSSATNSMGGVVTVSDSSATAGVVSGDAAGLGVSASGASVDMSVASFDSTVVGSVDPAFGGPAAIDDISQAANNAAAVTLTGAELGRIADFLRRA